jgi:hypothetical protein
MSNVIKISTFWILMSSFSLGWAQIVQQEESLNGEWDIIFDFGNQGNLLGLHNSEVFAEYIPKRKIEVPSSWELLEQDYEGVAWYGKTFSAQQKWENKSVRLGFDASNYRTEVWVNGVPAGQHEGGYTGFEFEVGDLLHFDKDNFVAVRVIGPIVRENLIIDGLGRLDMPHWRGALTGGIWQSVYLRISEECFVNDIFVEPRIDENAAKVNYQFKNISKRARSFQAYVAIFEKLNVENPVDSWEQELTLLPGTEKGSVVLQWDNPKLWSVDDPNLYLARVVLKDGERVINQNEVSFGMRHFEIKNDDFYLNGEKIIIRSGFWEGLYPHTLAAPPSKDYVRKEIELAKELGFNLLRPWRRQCPKPILDMADEMGMMIIASPAIECMGQWPAESPRMEERIMNEFEEMVLRDRNHPSVICWELYNEIHRHSIGRLKHKTAVFVRDLDPTRLIVDESGGWVGGAHAYNPGEMEPIDINEIHSYKRAPVDNVTYNNFVHLGKTDEEFEKLGIEKIGHTNSKIIPDKLIFISEIGYGGFPDLDSTTSALQQDGNPKSPIYRYHHRMKDDLNRCIDEMEIRSVFPTVSAFCQASQTIQANGNKLQLESALLNDKLDGYCLHAFTGGDWIVGAGILDIFRNKKKTFDTIKEVNKELYLPVRTNKPAYFIGENVALSVHALNRGSARRLQFTVDIMDENGISAFQKKGSTNIEGNIIEILTEQWKASKPGHYTLIAQMHDSGSMITQNNWHFTVYPQVTITDKNVVAYYDESGHLDKVLGTRKLNNIRFSGQTSVNTVIVGEVKDQGVINHLKRHAQSGGTVVFLKPPLSGLFDKPLKTDAAGGNWVPVNHVVKDHPVFYGLPQNTMMDQVYQNVIPHRMILDVPATQLLIAGAVTWDWYKDYRFDQNYLGPGETYWGSTFSEIPFGEGQVVLSMLRILENIDDDPVAKKLFYNILNSY